MHVVGISLAFLFASLVEAIGFVEFIVAAFYAGAYGGGRSFDGLSIFVGSRGFAGSGALLGGGSKTAGDKVEFCQEDENNDQSSEEGQSGSVDGDWVAEEIKLCEQRIGVDIA